MTFNTGNPVGSTDARDLYDNAQNLDRFANGQDLEYEDRLGVTRKSLAGIRAEVTEALSRLGYQVIGDYATGLVVQNFGQVFRKDGEFYRAKAETTLPYPLTGDWATDAPNFVSVGDAVLRQELAGADGGQLIGYGQTNVAERLSADVGVRQFGAAADGITDDLAAVSAAIAAVAQTGRAVDLGGRTVFSATEPANPYGVRLENGKLLVPSRVAGLHTQHNSYAPDLNGIMVGRENLATWWKSITAGVLQNIYLYGDSTVETGPAFPVKPHELFQQALYACGTNNAKVINRGVSGTSWSDLNAIPDLGSGTRLVVIKYGINDAVKTNALATFAADARAKLAAIRGAANGDYYNLSILLMGPNSTYRPSTGQDAKWYEQLRNVYVQLCKEYSCAYFDTYAYLQDSSLAPGWWQDSVAPNEGIHPDPVAVYWIWREGIKTFVLGDGQWNISKSNQFWNINNYTRVAASGVTPDGYNYGVTVESALTANGFPFNGALITIRHADGIASQRLCSQDVVPRTAERRGGASAWTQWSGVPTPITPLNSWINKGGGYASAGYQIGADGFVDLYGVLAGGAASSTAFNLPVPARPAAAHEFRLASSGTATLFADGNFIVTGASSTMLSLDGIRFRALG